MGCSKKTSHFALNEIHFELGVKARIKFLRRNNLECYNVVSSNLDEVCFDNQTSILCIYFKNNSVYEYLNVPYSEFQNLLHSGSKGRYLDSYIKPVYHAIKRG